jgi:voltage-gated potassium channel
VGQTGRRHAWARDGIANVEPEPVDERAERIQARFEWPMVIAALLVIPVIWIESSEPGEPLDTIGDVLNWLTWLAFLIEMVVMLHVSPRPTEWLRRHPLDAIVVVLSPPFLPGPNAVLRILRLTRVVRLARVFSVRGLLSLEGVAYALFLVAFVVLMGGAVYATFETQNNLWDGIWWAVVTVTTVGYGDLSPVTTEGRITAIVVMFVGIGFVAFLTAFIADRFIRRETAEVSEHERQVLAELREIRSRLERLERGQRA